MRARWGVTGGVSAAVAVAAAGTWWLVSAVPGAVPNPAPSSQTPGPASASGSGTESPEPGASPGPTVNGPALGWGPSHADWQRALDDASALTVEQAAGQVIVASWNSPSAAGVESHVADLGLGGVILMGDAITDADSVLALTAAARDGGGQRDWGTVVSVDQEGGTVARLRGLMPDLPGFMAAGAARDKGVVEDVYAQAAVDMHSMGFTVDYAPVADMTIGPEDPIIRTRSPGDDPDNAAATVVAAVEGFVAGGVVPVVKHFPGHGSVTVDSHDGVPRHSATLAELEQRDLVPFARAIDSGAPALMMGHVAVSEWGDAPATLAAPAYDYVREQLGFDGVVFTDALNMGAIVNSHEPGEAAVAALAAGADVLLLPPDPRAARDAIVAAVASGEVARERLDEAAARVILLQRWQQGLTPVADAGADFARELAIAGATVAARDCESPLVAGEVTIAGGWDYDRASLARALEERGITVGDGGTTITLMGADDATARADVVVAMGGPWGLEDSSGDVLVGLYGRSPDALAGLADVLVGAAAPGGDWPVALDVAHDVCG